MGRRDALASVAMTVILFDWDGTLANSQTALFEANAAVMAQFGLPFDRDLYRRYYSPDWRLMYRRLGVPEDRLDEANATWLDSYAALDGVELFDGVRGALERLTDAGHSLGVVSAGHRAVVLRQIEHLGVEDLLPVRVFGDDLVEQKPDPAPILRAVALASGPSRDRSQIAYLGDAPDDMLMAVRAGVRAIGVSTGMGEPADLIAAGAEVVVNSVAAWAAGELNAAGGALTPAGSTDPARRR